MKFFNLILVLLYTPFVFSQNTENKKTITNTNDVLTFYSDRGSLMSACTGTLILEDFSGGPQNDSGNTGCSGDISSAGDSCFPAGEIQEGLVITSSNTDVNEDYMVFTPAGFASNTVDVVGSNQLESFTIVEFNTGNTNTVALDFYSLPFGDTVEARVFGNSGLIDTVTITDLPGPVFFGFISSEPIMRIEFQDVGSYVEMVGQVAFGSCESVTSINDFTSNIFSFSPNPVINNLVVKAKKTINFVSIFNIFGERVKFFNPLSNSTTIDLSDLESGTYFVKAGVKNGTEVFKIIKK